MHGRSPEPDRAGASAASASPGSTDPFRTHPARPGRACRPMAPSRMPCAEMDDAVMFTLYTPACWTRGHVPGAPGCAAPRSRIAGADRDLSGVKGRSRSVDLSLEGSAALRCTAGGRQRGLTEASLPHRSRPPAREITRRERRQPFTGCQLHHKLSETCGDGVLLAARDTR